VIVGGILTPIENALAWLLQHLHDNIGLSWGWSIVALTLIVRIALVPLMVKQIHSMQRMQAHLPEMKAIQQKYKGDRQKLNEELMKFYKENSINPAASCLPILFQFPIFIALYFVLRNFASHTNAAASELGWLIVPNITKNITSHWSGWVLVVIYVISQVSYGYFSAMPNMPKSQRVLMMVLPIFILPFILHPPTGRGFPVGLLIYWMTTNLWTVGQGIVTRRMRVQPAQPVRRSSRTAARTTTAAEGDGNGGAAKEAPATAAAAVPPRPPRKVRRKKRQARR
jgi:YidC/Oxa1 family membrane protein insertase